MASIRKKQKDAADREALKGEIKREIQSNSFEPDGDSIEEKTRYAKETGINFRKQKPQPKGGSARDDKAFQHVSKMMRSMSGGRPTGQRPQQKGKKPPTAGQYGAPPSPAQKVAKRRADAKRAQDNMSSRFD